MAWRVIALPTAAYQDVLRVPNYYCQGSAELVDGRGARHMNVGRGLACPRALIEVDAVGVQR